MVTGPAARAGRCAAVTVPANRRPRAARMRGTRRICNLATVLPPTTLESDRVHARRCAERSHYGRPRLPPQPDPQWQRTPTAVGMALHTTSPDPARARDDDARRPLRDRLTTQRAETFVRRKRKNRRTTTRSRPVSPLAPRSRGD